MPKRRQGKRESTSRGEMGQRTLASGNPSRCACGAARARGPQPELAASLRDGRVRDRGRASCA